MIKPLLLAICAIPSFQAPPESRPEGGSRNVAILVYPEVELLDFAGPGEVFAAVHGERGHAYTAYTVAETREPITSMGYVKLTPKYTLADCPKPDVVVIPGGSVPATNPALLAWVKARAKDTEIVMSVCNGALLLGNAGLLANLEVTTHKSALESLALIEPTAKVFTNRRFVDNGRIVTAAGVSAGIDGALHVVSRLNGEEAAWATARYMEYDWRPDEIAQLHAQPGRPVSDSPALALANSFKGLDAKAALDRYRRMEPMPTEAELNRYGYRLLEYGKHEQAQTLLALATLAFPQSANAHDSLSEAHEVGGNVEQAKQLARQTLLLLEKEPGQPEGQRQGIRNAAASRIARLEGKPLASFPFACPDCNSRCDKQGFLEGGACPVCRMELVARAKSD